MRLHGSARLSERDPESGHELVVIAAVEQAEGEGGPEVAGSGRTEEPQTGGGCLAQPAGQFDAKGEGAEELVATDVPPGCGDPLGVGGEHGQHHGEGVEDGSLMDAVELSPWIEWALTIAAVSGPVITARPQSVEVVAGPSQ